MQGISRILLSLFLGSYFGNATPVNGTLNLGEAAGENEITLALSAFGFESVRTTVYSGVIDLELVLDLEADSVTGFQMIGGAVEATDVSFLFESPFIFSQTVDTIDYRALPKSLSGMEILANPGVFDATEHVFFFNEGRTVSDGTFGPSESLVSDGPFDAAGTTTGTISLTRTQTVSSTITGGEIAIYYDADFSVSLDSTSFPDPEDESTFIDTRGTVTAGGMIIVYLHPFYEWASESFPEAGDALAFTADANGDGMADGISWALGQVAGFQETVDLTFQNEEGQLQLILPESGTRAPVTIQTSQTLAPGSWVDVEGAAVSTGENPIPSGTTGPVTISPGSASAAYYRLWAIKPE